MSTSNTANNFGSPSDDAQHGVAGNADAGGGDASDDGTQPADEDLDIPVPLAAVDEENPQPLVALPIDFNMEDNLPLTDAQKHHQVTFYQAALSSFLVKGSNSSMMNGK